MQGEFDFPTRVVFGPGRVRELPELVRGWGEQALIVTDSGVLASGAAERVLNALKADQNLDYRVFEHVEANPSAEIVEAGVRRFQEECRFLIAVGGGSAIDTAKAIRLAVGRDSPQSRMDDWEEPAAAPAGMPRLIAIPTTSGTGSEVSSRMVISVEGRKTTLHGPHLLPDIALCDPEMTLELSARLTAGSGVDALGRNVEAYFAASFHPLCDAIALDGIRRAVQALPLAVSDSRNIDARSEMMLAALMGGVASQKGLGVVHSLTHALAAVGGVHHGVAMAIMLPHGLRFNQEVIAPRVDAVCRTLGVSPSASAEGTVEALVEALEQMLRSLRLPGALREVGLTSALIPAMAEVAFQDGHHRHNPRPVTQEDLEAIYRAAF